MNPFIVNSCLTPKVSINRMKFMSLGGLRVDEGLAGKTGLELVSAETFTKNIDNFLKDQNFDTLEDDNLNLFLDCLEAGNTSREAGSFKAEPLWSSNSEPAHPTVELIPGKIPPDWAESIVRRFARNLGHLLLALKRGDLDNRNQRHDWGDAEWDFWRGVQSIILCGGLTQGVLGSKIKKYILEFFEESGMSGAYKLEIPPNSRSLPIIGACRLFSEICGEGSGLIFDFGHSYVKRSLADFKDGRWQIHILDKRRSEFMQLPPDNDLQTAKALHGFILETIADTYRLVLEKYPQVKPSHEIVISIANYIQNGVPDASRGGYSKLSLLCHNYQEFLSWELTGRLKSSFGLEEEFRVKLVHDGMSAAYALDCDGEDFVAVISLGTGIGLGFPPDYRRRGFDYLMVKD